MSQWAEIRHMHEVEGVAKKEIARRMDLDIKTVRRALGRRQAPVRRRSPVRRCALDPLRERIEQLLREDPELTAKRIARLLDGQGVVPRERAVREYVAKLRDRLFRPDAFVHRTHQPGDSSEFDFGESRARIAGKVRTVKYLVGVLPSSNVYFAKGFPAERLECLLDGMLAGFRFFGGVPKRAVLDNTSLAVREVLRGPDRIETKQFEAFRGTLALRADLCAPASGWEKGSVERGVEYVRDNVFRPMPDVGSFDELNAMILAELDRDLDRRKLPDGRTARQAWIAEREHLRPLPAHEPETCRIVPVVADKFAHVRVDRSTYAVEKRAKAEKLSPDQLLVLRRTESAPILVEIWKLIDEYTRDTLPKSALGEALGYATNQWEALGRFVDDPALDMDNNAAERALRMVAVGRKNWLFAGSPEGGRRAALIYSLVGSCKLLGIDPFAYLRDVLSRVAAHPTSRIAELTPRGWKEARATQPA